MDTSATVLLLEDNDDARRMLRRLLHGQGLTVLRARTIDEAFMRIDRGEQIDAALLDLMLPDGCGIAVLAKLKNDRPKCRIVVMTAAGDELVDEAQLYHVPVFRKPLLDLPGLTAALSGATAQTTRS